MSNLRLETFSLSEKRATTTLKLIYENPNMVHHLIFSLILKNHRMLQEHPQNGSLKGSFALNAPLLAIGQYKSKFVIISLRHSKYKRRTVWIYGWTRTRELKEDASKNNRAIESGRGGYRREFLKTACAEH